MPGRLKVGMLGFSFIQGPYKDDPYFGLCLKGTPTGPVPCPVPYNQCDGFFIPWRELCIPTSCNRGLNLMIARFMACSKTNDAFHMAQLFFKEIKRPRGSMGPHVIVAIKPWGISKSVLEKKRFYGLVPFDKRFKRNFSFLVAPIKA